jgi:hypothetical protein
VLASGFADVTEGDRVAAAFGEEVAAESEHVGPAAQVAVRELCLTSSSQPRPPRSPRGSRSRKALTSLFAATCCSSTASRRRPRRATSPASWRTALSWPVGRT